MLPPVPTPAKDYRAVLLRQILREELPRPELEYKFDPSRGWRIDLAYPELKLAIEVEGMAHRVRERFLSDIEKYDALMFAGWRLLRIYTRWICDEKREHRRGIELVKRAFG